MKVAEITASSTPARRNTRLQKFSTGKLDVLVAFFHFKTILSGSVDPAISTKLDIFFRSNHRINKYSLINDDE